MYHLESIAGKAASLKPIHHLFIQETTTSKCKKIVQWFFGSWEGSYNTKLYVYHEPPQTYHEK